MTDTDTHPGTDPAVAMSQEQLANLYLSRKQMREAATSHSPDPLAWYQPVKELGLETYAADLDAYGYTVVEPERVASPDFVDRITETILRVATERTGVPHSLDAPGNPGKYVTSVTSADSQLLFYMLFEDEIFEEWLENPVLGALIDHMMRGQAQLSSLTSFIRWHNPIVEEDFTLPLHSDSPGSPEGVLPLGHDLVCNAALVLTEYTKENGALAVVPGSHRFARQPVRGEDLSAAVPVEAPVGSLILWHGGTWHGAFPRTTPGIRLNLTSYHCHRALKTQEAYKLDVTDEMLARRSARFARLMGADDPMGWRKQGPDYIGAATYAQKTTEAGP